MGNWGTTTSRIAHNQAESEHVERPHQQQQQQQQQQHSMDQYGSGGGSVYQGGNNAANRQGPTVGQSYPNNQFSRANPNVTTNYNKPKNMAYSGSTGGGSGRKYGGGGNPHMNHSSSSSNYQQYHNQYHENNGATYTVPSIVTEKDFNHLDDLINNSGGQSIESHNYRRAIEPLSNGIRGTDSTADYENGAGEENWAYISQNVDYNEKIQFLDDEDDEQATAEEPKTCVVEAQMNEEATKQSQARQGELEHEEPASWDQKRKYNECSEDLKKSIERARLRRAEEERRLSEQRQAVCAEKLRQLNLKKASAPVAEQQSAVESVAQQVEVPQVPGYPIRPPPSDLLFVAKPAHESPVKPLIDNEDRDESKGGRANLSTGGQAISRNTRSPQFNQNTTTRGGQRHNLNNQNKNR